MTTPDTPTHGLHRNIPFDTYRGWPGANNSQLTDMDRSPAYCKMRQTAPRTSTPAMVLGSAIHCAVLEPLIFGTCYGVRPKGYSIAAWQHENDDKTDLTQEQWDKCVTTRDRVLRHPRVKALLDRADAVTEVSMVWEDDETGVPCKGRVDVLAGGVVADLKVSRNAHPSRFPRVVQDLGIHRQAAFYMDGLRWLGMDPQHFRIIAVESTAPFEVTVYELDPETLDAGAVQYRPLLRRWAKCHESGVWPGYSETVEQTGLPEWALNQILPDRGAPALTIGGKPLEV